MAYNPYLPVGYQPNYFQQPVYQQPVQQQQSGIIWVSGDAEAEAFPVGPNAAVRLWHSTLPIVYFKAADSSGKPTLKAYDLVERTQSVSEATSPRTQKGTDYATKTEVDALSEAVAALEKEMKKLRKKEEPDAE